MKLYIYITRLFGLILLQYYYIVCSGACADRYLDWPNLTNNIPFIVSAQETKCYNKYTQVFVQQGVCQLYVTGCANILVRLM